MVIVGRAGVAVSEAIVSHTNISGIPAIVTISPA